MKIRVRRKRSLAYRLVELVLVMVFLLGFTANFWTVLLSDASLRWVPWCLYAFWGGVVVAWFGYRMYRYVPVVPARRRFAFAVGFVVIVWALARATWGLIAISNLAFSESETTLDLMVVDNDSSAPRARLFRLYTMTVYRVDGPDRSSRTVDYTNEAMGYVRGRGAGSRMRIRAASGWAGYSLDRMVAFKPPGGDKWVEAP